jgi:hypothetical protein
MQIFGGIVMVTGLAAAIFAMQVHRFFMRSFPWAYSHWWGWSPTWDHWRIRFAGIFLAVVGFLLLIGIVHSPQR